MKKTNIFSYLKILGGLSLTFPLSHVFFALDFGLLKGGFIAIGLYTAVMLIAIPMYNYLEYGLFCYWVRDKVNGYDIKFSKKRTKWQVKFGNRIIMEGTLKECKDHCKKQIVN